MKIKDMDLRMKICFSCKIHRLTLMLHKVYDIDVGNKNMASLKWKDYNENILSNFSFTLISI